MAATVDTRPSRGRTDYEISGDSIEEVQEAIDKIMASYNPLGYGTTFGTIRKEDGRFVARGHRYNSAD